MKKSPFRIWCIVALFALGLNGCGQRGALYLPEPPSQIPKPAGYDKTEQSKTRSFF
jgi:predicted small lipoprotein YifL